MSTEPQPVTVVPPLVEQLATLLPPPANPASTAVLASKENPPLQATTTSEQDLKSQGQRALNMLWERTQAVIALEIVNAAIIFAFVSLWTKPNEAASYFFVSAFSLVVGFYFSRVNHARIGDEPNKPGALDTR